MYEIRGRIGELITETWNEQSSNTTIGTELFSA